MLGWRSATRHPRPLLWPVLWLSVEEVLRPVPSRGHRDEVTAPEAASVCLALLQNPQQGGAGQGAKLFLCLTLQKKDLTNSTSRRCSRAPACQ